MNFTVYASAFNCAAGEVLRPKYKEERDRSKAGPKCLPHGQVITRQGTREEKKDADFREERKLSSETLLYFVRFKTF